MDYTGIKPLDNPLPSKVATSFVLFFVFVVVLFPLFCFCCFFVCVFLLISTKQIVTQTCNKQIPRVMRTIRLNVTCTMRGNWQEIVYPFRTRSIAATFETTSTIMTFVSQRALDIYYLGKQ